MESTALDQALEKVRFAFSKIPKPVDIPGCEHCLPKHEVDKLLATIPAELSEEVLSPYAGDVFLTVGSDADFAYFWPRILELSVRDKFFWPDPEVALGKLRLAHWEQWPDRLREPVREVIDIKFDDVVKDGDPDRIDEWLCGIGRCVPDIRPYLERLVNGATRESLLGFINANQSAYSKNKPGNSFWEDAPENSERLVQWLKSSPVKDLLSEAYGMQF